MIILGSKQALYSKSCDCHNKMNEEEKRKQH